MKRAVVTGANRGIGLELCRQLPAHGYEEVVAVCRKSCKELDRSGARIITGIDVADATSIAKLEGDLKNETIDLLINNAGILTSETLLNLDFDRMRRQFEVNALGPLRVTQALLSNLKKGSKVAIITSRVGSLADNRSGGYYGYRMSKAAVNMAGVNLALDLRGKGIAVFLLHPGLVATKLTGGVGIPPSESAANLLARLAELNIEQTGTFWHANGERLPW